MDAQSGTRRKSLLPQPLGFFKPPHLKDTEIVVRAVLGECDLRSDNNCILEEMARTHTYSFDMAEASLSYDRVVDIYERMFFEYIEEKWEIVRHKGETYIKLDREFMLTHSNKQLRAFALQPGRHCTRSPDE